MKNILITGLIFVANYCTAQVYVNQIDVNKFDYQYIEVWEHFDRQSEKFNAMVDYGQNAPKESQGLSYKVNQLNGEPMKFNSTIAMLNFLYKNGWELAGIKTIGEINSYVMKRKPKMEKKESAATDTSQSSNTSDKKKSDDNEKEEKNED